MGNVKKDDHARFREKIRIGAFTLAELIVVIAVLAVLATVGFLALSGYSQDAKDAAVKANVRSVATAVSSESALTGNSPRYYVAHDDSASLTWAAVVYVSWTPTVLTGGNWDQSGTNYSAGNPDWAKLKLNPEKFRLSDLGSRLWESFRSANAAYDPKQVSVWALEAVLPAVSGGRTRYVSYFQAVGTAPATGAVSVAGNFPRPTAAEISSGAAGGLVKSPSWTGALVEGEIAEGTSGSQPAVTSTSSCASAGQTGTSPSTYSGCGSPDIIVCTWAGTWTVWASCNVGSTVAGTGVSSYGSHYQWGRNDTTFTATSSAPFDWKSPQDGNLWWGGSTSLGVGVYGGQTAGNKTLMKGPCATGYHVPTQAEWWFTMKALHPALTNTETWQSAASVASVLKLPLPGERNLSSSLYVSQGSVGYYWTSTPNGGDSHIVPVNFAQVFPGYKAPRANGFSVRCLKD